MNKSNQSARWIRSLLAMLLLSLAGVVNAFPPTLPHTIYGTARDEYGNPIGTNAIIVLTTQSGTTVSTRIEPEIEPGVNYRIVVPLDAGVKADPYKAGALSGTVAFRIRVTINGTSYLPFQMAGNYTLLGEPGKRTRIDLTLGEDLNGNGLPDAWERAIIAARGWNIGLDGLRADSSPGNNGLTLLQEYIAGTYGLQDENGLALDLIGVDQGVPLLEFLAIRGRTYSIMGSADLAAWQGLPFREVNSDQETPLVNTHLATSVRVIRVAVPPNSNQPATRFFKLRIQ